MVEIALTPEKHKEQIAAYSKVIGGYQIFAGALRHVLEDACRTSLPEALIQSREKSLSSFAEKVARKSYKYHNPVEEFADLCAARVIVQTLEQVEAVCEFIEANFEVVQKDDKGCRLGENIFGYRDMHYLVRLLPKRDEALHITLEERAVIDHLSNRIAEIQVRTWLQHAWADISHDRIYKNSLLISRELARTGNRLTAQMEEGDQGFDQLASELDGLIANYTAFAPKAEVKQEIGIQELLLENEPDPAKKPVVALKLARLYAANGEDSRIIDRLEQYADLSEANRGEILLELGSALCRLHCGTPSADAFRRGLECLGECVAFCEATEATSFVPNRRKRESIHAKALSWLGWAWEHTPGQEGRALGYYQRAHEHEPGNPYYLAGMIGAEMRGGGSHGELAVSLRPVIRVAAKTCQQHARAGIELPVAYFTAGRLLCLLNEEWAALGWYARGARHYLAGEYCVPKDALLNESDWLSRIYKEDRISSGCRQILDFLSLASHVSQGSKPEKTRPLMDATVLIVAGGADGCEKNTAEVMHPILSETLAAFRGTVISGGTTAGVPGCVGDIAGKLGVQCKKRFQLIAYQPECLPDHVEIHSEYDETVKEGNEFGPSQILRYWSDIIAAGIHPRNVHLLGIGGGSLSALEYRVALSLGAAVGLVKGTGGAVDALLNDPIWNGMPNLLPVVDDPMTVRSFVVPEVREFEPALLESMAREFHARYVADNTSRLPARMKPWAELKETFRKANREQAAYAMRILESAGFGLRASKSPIVFDSQQFTPEEIESMARMEHGRWNMERLRDGWRQGPRDDVERLHDCLVPWGELPDAIRKFDRDAVLAFPRILAEAGVEIYRF
ncbi:MAG: RyR domain-containing protein [Chthoniobacteraceae bacterium]|nr:RyR domain-containing protein [Chthoniobacteraceae bacterium]